MLHSLQQITPICVAAKTDDLSDLSPYHVVAAVGADVVFAIANEAAQRAVRLVSHKQDGGLFA